MIAAGVSFGTVTARGIGGTSSDNGDGTFSNPVIWADVPDPDVIRVDDTYYMVSTTMHMSPGVPIMKSYDLVNWETVNYVYDQLEENDACALKNNKNDYANGSWASTIRYDKYEKRYYVEFSCQSTNKSYFFTTDDIENGTWHRSETVKCYDASMLFEDTGTECKKYIIYEDTTTQSDSNMLCMREMYVDKDTWDITVGEQIVLIERPNVEEPPKGLKAEGVHAYKIGDYYYMFMIQGESWQRQEICWRSDSLTPGSFEVKKIFTGNIVGDDGKDVMPYTGVAQGGIVDTKDGNWYAMLFEDHGSVGRIPVLIPMDWDDEKWPVLGNGGKSVDEILDMPVYDKERKSIVVSDEFNNKKTRKKYSDSANDEITAGIAAEDLENAAEEGRIDENEYGYNGSNLSLAWQLNHNPNNNLWSLTEREGYLRLKSGLLSPNIQKARNTLTQRTYGPTSAASTVVETAHMKDGDYAGLSVFQNQYGNVGVKVENGNKYIIMHRATQKGDDKGEEIEAVPFDGNEVYLKVFCDFSIDENKSSNPKCIDKAYFYYSLDNEEWIQIGDELNMAYDWPHFVGYRFGLFYYSTLNVGGYVDFDYFHIADDMDSPYIPEPKEAEDEETPANTPDVPENTQTSKPTDVPQIPQSQNTPTASHAVQNKKINVSAAGYVIKYKKLNMTKGSKTKLKVTDAYTKDSLSGVTFTSSDKKVAAVSGKGVVKVKKTGTAKITVSAKDSAEKTVITINAVKKEKVNKKLVIKKKSINLRKGNSAVIDIKRITAGTTSKIKYSSANKKIARVDAYGTVKAVKSGNTKIRVICGTKKVEIKVKVS